MGMGGCLQSIKMGSCLGLPLGDGDQGDVTWLLSLAYLSPVSSSGDASPGILSC